ncbi:MAG: hypothetical protein ACJ74G_19330 [Blastocatellia bacterium]
MSRTPRTGSVRVLLDGIMLGCYHKAAEDAAGGANAGPAYEVGVLRSTGHIFTICYTISDEANRVVSAAQVRRPYEGNWRLEIRDRPPDAALFINEGVDFDRLALSQQHSAPGVNLDDPIFMDFRWVMNLEGREFPKHPNKLELRRDVFHPTIRFPNGLVYAQKLSKDMTFQSFASDQPTPFGLISDIAGIDLDAQPGEEIVFRSEDDGTALFQFRLEQGQTVDINIVNMPPNETNAVNLPSHFQIFYRAFDNIYKEYNVQTKQQLSLPPLADHHHGGAMDHHHPGPAAPPAPPPPGGEIKVCGGDFGGGDFPLCGKAFLGDHQSLS